MIILPDWLIVYGTNRNAGKTTLITRIIRQFKAEIPICAIKISPHFHDLGEDPCILARTDKFVIVKETKTRTGKDSSRMLEAGAGIVLYIQVWDNDLVQVLPVILGHIPPGSAVICESGWMRNLVAPGVFLILNRKGEKEIKDNVAKLKSLADRWIEFDGNEFDFQPDELIFRDHSWKLE